MHVESPELDEKNELLLSSVAQSDVDL